MSSRSLPTEYRTRSSRARSKCSDGIESRPIDAYSWSNRLDSVRGLLGHPPDGPQRMLRRDPLLGGDATDEASAV